MKRLCDINQFEPSGGRTARSLYALGLGICACFRMYESHIAGYSIKSGLTFEPFRLCIGQLSQHSACSYKIPLPHCSCGAQPRARRLKTGYTCVVWTHSLARTHVCVCACVRVYVFMYSMNIHDKSKRGWIIIL